MAASEELAAPSSAVVWTKRQFTDLKGWYSLPKASELELKPTKFADGRLKFLDPVSATPDVFTKVISGQFDVKSWAKEECSIVVDGEKAIYMKFPGVEQVVSYSPPERLPTFTKTWKPIVFMLNPTTFTVRLTEDLALMLTREKETVEKFTVHAVDYNKGYCCVHPCTGIGLCYGAYICSTLTNCLSVPYHESEKGCWGFFVQFYPWGGMVLPKAVEITKPTMSAGLCGGASKWERFGLVFIPPKLYLNLTFMIPAKTTRVMNLGKDFAVTAKKVSDSDIVVYLLLDGQLAQFSYSFDIRVNKPEKPKTFVPLKFKIIIDKENPTKWTLAQTKDCKSLIPHGGPTEDFEHLISDEVIAVFDAEIGQYLTHPQGFKLTTAFKKIATEEETQTTECGISKPPSRPTSETGKATS